MDAVSMGVVTIRRDDGGGDDGLDDNGRGAMKVAAAKLAVWTTAVAVASMIG